MIDTKYLLGTAGFAAVAAFWGQIKEFFVRFKSIFIVTAKIRSGADRALVRYLWKNFRCGMLGNRSYLSIDIFVRPNNAPSVVTFEDIGNSLTFFKGWKPIFVSNDDSGNNKTFSISFIRGTFKIDQLLINAVSEFNNFEKNREAKEGSTRYYVRHLYGHYSKGDGDSSYGDEPVKEGTGDIFQYRPLGYDWKDLGSPIVKSPFSSLFYSDEIQDFVKYLERWKNSEDWYKERGLPWRLGALLKGLPGTGKSSFVRAIGQHFDFPIDVYNIISMSNSELIGFWQRSLNRAPCIVLIEDIDRIFDKDKLIQQDHFSGKGKLTMDGLLNTISGVESSNGILVFITANDATKLDEALGIQNEQGISTRPGRLDKILTFETMPKHCREAVANLILSDCKHLINRTVADGNGETGAQFSKRCSDIALREYWKPQENVSPEIRLIK